MKASREYMSFMYLHKEARSPGMWKSAKKAPATLKNVHIFLSLQEHDNEE